MVNRFEVWLGRGGARVFSLNYKRIAKRFGGQGAGSENVRGSGFSVSSTNE
jgi:hypothetical protein